MFINTFFIEKDILIKSDTHLKGMVKGDIFITNDSTLTFSGVLDGYIYVEKGSSLALDVSNKDELLKRVFDKNIRNSLNNQIITNNTLIIEQELVKYQDKEVGILEENDVLNVEQRNKLLYINNVLFNDLCSFSTYIL